MPQTAKPCDDARDSCTAAVFQAQLWPGTAPIAAPAAQPLLRSALDAGIEMTSSCRNGTCRACIRQLGSGQVTYRIEWPGLSAEEKAEGYILPCVAHPASDLVLRAPDRNNA